MEISTYGPETAQTVLIQMVDQHDLDMIEREVSLIKENNNIDFRMIAIKVNDWFSIGLDTPGIVMVKYSGRDIKEVHVSDPTYANKITNLVINGKRTAVELPSGDMAGSSIKVEL